MPSSSPSALTVEPVSRQDHLLQVIDTDGAIVTLDAMHTQADTAATIRAGGAHYVSTVKANNKHLYAQPKELPWKYVPARTMRGTGHGRRETRTTKTADVPAWITFEGAAHAGGSLPQLTRKRHRGLGLASRLGRIGHHHPRSPAFSSASSTIRSQKSPKEIPAGSNAFGKRL
jgi:predicted transposase YbfD/YdcC